MFFFFFNFLSKQQSFYFDGYHLQINMKHCFFVFLFITLFSKAFNLKVFVTLIIISSIKIFLKIPQNGVNVVFSHCRSI